MSEISELLYKIALFFCFAAVFVWFITSYMGNNHVKPKTGKTIKTTGVVIAVILLIIAGIFLLWGHRIE